MDPRLYIIMRTDMDSMNAGKGMAQAAHAANAFEFAMEMNKEDLSVPMRKAWADWGGSTLQGFGTTITVAAYDEQEMDAAVKQALDLGLPAEVIHDPTYPVTDGRVTHLIPVNTCGYIFVPEPDLAPRLLARLPLHP